MNIAKKGLTKTEIQDKNLANEMKVLEQYPQIYEALYNSLEKQIDGHMQDIAMNGNASNRTAVDGKPKMLDIFDNIEKILVKPEYNIQTLETLATTPTTIMTDEQKIEIGISIISFDKYLDIYKQFMKSINSFTKKDMSHIYDIVTVDSGGVPVPGWEQNFLMQRNMIFLKYFHDFLKQTENLRNKLYQGIQKRIKEIRKEMSTSDMIKDYVSSQISNLLVDKVSEINIKQYADEIKRMSKEIRDFIPRTKSEHVGISMHKIRGGKQNGILWKNLFNKYNRNDLNLISKHYGLKNIEKIRNKKTIINKLNFIVLYRSGNLNKRKELNFFSKQFGINPKLYKTKKDLIHKLNQTIF